jgi:hypothetical protein
VGSSARYLGIAVGFGFGVVWMTVGIGSAILVLLCAAFGCAVALVAERERGSLRRVQRDEDEPLLFDEAELEHFERHDDELVEDEPVAVEAEYGWPSPRA